MRSLQNFKAYQMAKSFYLECVTAKIVGSGLKDQLLRASSSVALNLAEGSVKQSTKDRARFYEIALASVREVQSILDLQGRHALQAKADALGAITYKLVRATRSL